MKSNFIYGAVAVAMVITIAAFLSEETVENKTLNTETAFQAFPDDRRPGDQRVRDHSRGSVSRADQKGVRQGQGGNVSAAGAGGGGLKSGLKKGTQTAKSGSDRFGERGRASYGKIGSESIPVFVKGVQKGEIGGQILLGQLNERVVLLRRGPRLGWGVVEALKLAGIEEGGRATFTAREGDSKTVEWSMLETGEGIYILSYNQSGQLLLLSGKEIDMEDPGSRKEKRGRQSRNSNSGGGIALQDIVKIEVS